MRALHLGKAFELPVELATETTLVVGKRGSGKSNTAGRIAEQVHGATVPTVVLDPVDNWFGIKSNREGTGPGLAFYVFGGKHSDLPLEPSAGRLMADVIMERQISAVLSVKHFSNAERVRFVCDFAERLYQKNTRPLHVVLEEAHEFAPQSADQGDKPMLGKVCRLWKLGRSAGIGGTAITQRPASLSKNITTQSEVLIVHRLLAPQDVDAIRAWIRYHGESEKILARETARRVLHLIEQRRTREIVEALREPDAMLRIATEGFPASVVIVGQEGIGRPEVAALIREAIAAHLERTFLNGEAPDA